MKIPLDNAGLERRVIGTLIGDIDAFWQIAGKLKPELFVTPVNQKIVRVLHDLGALGRGFSIPSIVSRLAVDDGWDFSPEGYLATLVADEADPGSLWDDFSDLEDMWARREMMRLGEALIKTSRDDSGLSAMERLDQAKADLDSLTDPLGPGTRHMAQVSERLLAGVQDASNYERTVGLDLGLSQMQDLMGSLMPGRLYVVAGPPGSGKSALAYQIAEFVSRQQVVLFESLEMEADELAERDLAGRTGISADRIERASVNAEELGRLYDASYEHRALRLHIDSTTGMTAAQIRNKALRLKRTEGLDLLVIDHLLYIQRANLKQGEFEGIRAHMQACKRIAKDLKIPVIVLTQLKKEFGEGLWKQIRRPSVNDLYGGSSVEQEADVILFVHRPEYLLKRKEPSKDASDFAEWYTTWEKVEGKAELILGKRRGGAGTGVRTVFFDAPRVLFCDNAPRAAKAAPSIDYGSLALVQ